MSAEKTLRELDKKITKSNSKHVELRAEIDELSGKKPTLLIAGKDVSRLNARIRLLEEEDSDIINVALPELKKQFEKAKKDRQDELRALKAEKINKIDGALYKDARNAAESLLVDMTKVAESAEKLAEVWKEHERKTGELKTLKATVQHGGDWSGIGNIIQRISGLSNLSAQSKFLRGISNIKPK